MLALTKQEKQVVLFVTAIGLAGILINYIVKSNSRIEILFDSCQYIGKVNLNTADKEALMGVSGIGEKLAQRIIEYRRENGRIQQMQELKCIKGMNQFRYEKIKDYVYIQ